MHTKAFGTFVPIFFSCSNEASHIDDTILLGTHSHTIRQVEHLFRNFLYRFTAIAIFTHFDEVSVFRKTCGVKQYRFIILIRKSTDFTKVLHGYGLSAGRVVRNGNDDKRYAVTMFLQRFFQLHRIDITFKRYFQLSILRFIDGAIQSNGLPALDMPLCGIKVRVPRNDISIMYQIREKHILGSTPLMGGNDIFKTSQTSDHFFQIEEGGSTCITFVAQHHRCPLAIAHCSRTGVSYQIDIYLFGFQLEHIVMGFFQPLFTFLAGTLPNGFHHFNFPRLCKR